MKSTVPERSIAADGYMTSIGLDEVFWTGPKNIARARHMTPLELIPAIRQCREGGLSSAVGAFACEHYRALVSAAPTERFGSHATIPTFSRDDAQAL